MKNKAFSYIEIILSIFIITSVIFPSLKISSQQLNTYKKINTYNDDLIFFNSIISHLKSKDNFITESIHIKNYQELKNTDIFKDLNIDNNKLENFSLDIEIEKTNIDFYVEELPSNLININFKSKRNSLFTQILIFEASKIE